VIEEKKIDDGGAAFPQTVTNANHLIAEAGMTLRDYFAAQALAHVSFQVSVEECATQCYLIADAMLEARKK